MAAASMAYTAAPRSPPPQDRPAALGTRCAGKGLEGQEMETGSVMPCTVHTPVWWTTT